MTHKCPFCKENLKKIEEDVWKCDCQKSKKFFWDDMGFYNIKEECSPKTMDELVEENNELREYLNRIATFADLDWNPEQHFPIDELFDRIYT